MESPRTTVFIVDDDPAVRKSLRWLIESVNLQVETFESAADFLRAYDPAKPGCLVLDVRMPDISGLELQESLARHNIHLPVIIITGYADVSMAIRAMKSGVIDFIEKPFNDQTLLDLVQKAIDVDVKQRQKRASADAVGTRIALLTDREREVMELVVSGLSNKQIAKRLDVSEKTIEVHRSRIMTKMDAANAVDLVRMVMATQPAAQ